MRQPFIFFYRDYSDGLFQRLQFQQVCASLALEQFFEQEDGLLEPFALLSVPAVALHNIYEQGVGIGGAIGQNRIANRALRRHGQAREGGGPRESRLKDRPSGGGGEATLHCL